MEVMKWKRSKKSNDKLTLAVIEKVNFAMKEAYCATQWITIQQGNDSY